MAEYRVDMVGDGSPRPLASETFTARDDNAAFTKAGKILKHLVTDPATQYGQLYRRDQGSACYLDQVEVAR